MIADLALVLATLVASHGLVALLVRWLVNSAWENEMDLLSYVPARRSDPETSKLAGKAIKPRVSEVRQQVLLYALDRPDGFTDHDLGQHFGCWSSTYRTRRSELTDRGEIVPTQQRRALPSGRTAVVWRHRSFMETKQ